MRIPDRSTLKGDLGAFLRPATDGALEPHEIVTHFVSSGHYSGGHFETYGTNDPHRITGDDILATTMLAIRIVFSTNSGITPWQLLKLETHADQVSEFLADIPADREIHTLSEREFDELLGPDSPAWALDELLRDGVGIPSVARQKLLARKRPGIIPILDRKVQDALLRRGRWWEAWWSALTSNQELVARLEAIRDAAAMPQLSLLRIADILVWMRQHGADKDSACPDLRERVGAPLPKHPR